MSARSRKRRRRKALATVQELGLLGPINETWAEAAHLLGAAVFSVPRYDSIELDLYVHPDLVPAIRTLLACTSEPLLRWVVWRPDLTQLEE